MNKVVFLPIPDRNPQDPMDELATLIQNSDLPDLLSELEAKLGVILDYTKSFQTISDAAKRPSTDV